MVSKTQPETPETLGEIQWLFKILVIFVLINLILERELRMSTTD